MAFSFRKTDAHVYLMKKYFTSGFHLSIQNCNDTIDTMITLMIILLFNITCQIVVDLHYTSTLKVNPHKLTQITCEKTKMSTCKITVAENADIFLIVWAWQNSMPKQETAKDIIVTQNVILITERYQLSFRGFCYWPEQPRRNVSMGRFRSNCCRIALV